MKSPSSVSSSGSSSRTSATISRSSSSWVSAIWGIVILPGLVGSVDGLGVRDAGRPHRAARGDHRGDGGYQAVARPRLARRERGVGYDGIQADVMPQDVTRVRGALEAEVPGSGEHEGPVVVRRDLVPGEPEQRGALPERLDDQRGRVPVTPEIGRATGRESV